MKNVRKLWRIVVAISFLDIYSHAATVETSIYIEEPSPGSPYGSWQLAHKDVEKMYRSPVEVNNDSRSSIPYVIKTYGIDIYNKKLYTELFLKSGAYHLEWKIKEGTVAEKNDKRINRMIEDDNVSMDITPEERTLLKKSGFLKKYHKQDEWESFDWLQALHDYFNSTIVSLPRYHLVVINRGTQSIHIEKIEAVPIFSTGGEACPGAAIIPPYKHGNIISMSWRGPAVTVLAHLIQIDPGEKKDIPLSIYVKDASMGDGPGTLGYALFLRYHDDRNISRRIPIAVIVQSEDYGFDTDW